jgi:hypothetical protein
VLSDYPAIDELALLVVIFPILPLFAIIGGNFRFPYHSSNRVFSTSSKFSPYLLPGLNAKWD